jgi:hypothetical protein
MSDNRTVKKIFPKDHKEYLSTDGRITSNRTFAKEYKKLDSLRPGSREMEGGR